MGSSILSFTRSDVPRSQAILNIVKCFLKMQILSIRHHPLTTTNNFKTLFSFWNRVKYFPSNTTAEKFKNATFSGYSVWIFVWGKLGQGNHVIIEKLSSTKSFVYKMFFVQKQKRKGVIFKFLQFEERFRKASFPWRFNLDGTPSNCRNKAMFSNFSGVARTGRNKYRGIEHISTDIRRI